MSVFLFRVKSTTFDRAQAKDGQPFVLHVKPDPLLDSCGAGDIAIICTEVNKSAPACFALSSASKDTPWRYTAKIAKYDSSRKDSHLLKFASGLEQHKNLGKATVIVTSTASGEVVESSVLTSAGCEGLDVTIEQPSYSFQVQTSRCNLLLDGELVIESDTEDTQAYRKIEDETYVQAIQSLISQKAEGNETSSQPEITPSTSSTSASSVSSPPSPPPSPPTTASSPPTPPSPTSTSQPQTPTTNKSESSQSIQPSPKAASPPPPPPSSSSSKLPPPPQPQPHKPKPRGRPPGSGRNSTSNAVVDPHHANGHGEKRENESKANEANKKAKLAAAAPPASVDLLMHVTSVAGMLKELDNEHSERLTRLEEDVAQLKARLANPSSPAPSPSITKESPVTARKTTTATVSHSPPSFQQKSQKPDPLQFTAGEFIAVRVDPSTSSDGYWMARVIPGSPKGGLVKVKWFEKYAPLPGWYFMDTREDLVDPLSIFHRNFELVVKPWKNRAGNFIDIFRPLEDLASFDAER